MPAMHHIHTPLEPLNIHYHDFEDTRLEDGPAEQRTARITRNREAESRVATLNDKRYSKGITIQQRQDFCTAFDQMSATDTPRPGSTQHNLDNSPFLSLPFELRQQVYELYYSFLDSAKIQDLSFDGTLLLTHYQTSEERWSPGRGIARNVFNELLGLPLACRIIYSESITHLCERVSIRFTDPEFAITIPKTISLKMLNAVRSLEFSFSLYITLDKIKTSRRNVLIASRYRLFRIEEWKLLWPALAGLRGLQHLNLKIHEQPPSMAVLSPRIADSLRHLSMPIGLSQVILDPLLCFEKGGGKEVKVDLCWQPEDTTLASMHACGIAVMVNGTLIERESAMRDIFEEDEYEQA